jgi:hypothetical protein
MKSGSEFADLFMPWAGLTAGVIAAGVSHQFGAEGTFDNCAVISPIPLLLVNLLGIAVVAAGALASWRILRQDAETHARKVIAFISVGASGLFLLAILLPMIASLVIPRCFE